ncbi:MAG TPA: hypothetical protein VK666_24730 [Chryseolinea sp.]|nr:hypothetical protein [Chryseolinea sp.]
MKFHMKYVFAAALSVLSFSSNSPDQFPQAEISNGLIHARIFLPDNKEGYYRGSRFDWAGVIPDLVYKGHTYFGQWFEKYSPTLHDAITGPVEAFSPVGYDDAKTGETFLKIGIGTVTKPEESKYAFANPYQIVNAGTWKIKRKEDQISFLQTLADKEYSYEYKKTIQLIKGQPEMVLLHTLKNTGKKIIETDVYNHNFFVMDKQPIGPDFIVKLPFKPTSESDGGVFGKFQDNNIVFLKELENNEHLFYRAVQGFSESVRDYEIRIENHKTGAAVKITCDQPLSKLVFWSAPKTVCPEPYIRFKINPGETFNWKIFYQFYLCDSL